MPGPAGQAAVRRACTPKAFRSVAHGAGFSGGDAPRPHAKGILLGRMRGWFLPAAVRRACTPKCPPQKLQRVFPVLCAYEKIRLRGQRGRFAR